MDYQITFNDAPNEQVLNEILNGTALASVRPPTGFTTELRGEHQNILVIQDCSQTAATALVDALAEAGFQINSNGWLQSPRGDRSRY